MQKRDKKIVFTKNAGGTDYEVELHFSQDSKENFKDKLLRAIKNEIAKIANQKTAE